MITKHTENKEDNEDFKPDIQGKGLNELIEKVKDMKVKEFTKKGKLNSNSKISFN